MSAVARPYVGPLRGSIDFYRARITLRLSKPTRLHAQHTPLLYALVSTAYGTAREAKPVMPDGVLLDAPEQCRLFLAKGDYYAFGMTILAHNPTDAAHRLDAIVNGLRAVGRRAPLKGLRLGGNFDVARVEDLVARQVRKPYHRLRAVSLDTIAREVDRAATLPELTLRFLSPLRCQRSKKTRHAGHAFFDRRYFSTHIFLHRLVKRLQTLGLFTDQFHLEPNDPSVADNQLVWIDASYGPKLHRKAIGGAVGRVTLRGCGPKAAEALVWGQYVRVGGQTRFGCGHYRIEELGTAEAPCPRSASLWDLATSAVTLDAAADRLELDSGMLREAVARVNEGSYRCDPHVRVPITNNGKTRVLAIPSRRDRALQRLVLDQIAPGIDLFLEESSLAYRHGLGRHRAAQRVREAYRRGYRWAVKADFAAFFDNVSHHELATRLEAYLADDDMTRLIMQWVQAGAPEADRGLPTGAPLSPLLANILLDQFDEQVTAGGGMLVRYADDFLILFHQEEQAQAMFRTARDAAAALELTLNREKTRLVDLDEPFEFLGYRFQKRDDWETVAPDEPTLLEDIGWLDSAKRRVRTATETRLPGESSLSARSSQASLIWGPVVSRLRTQGKQFLGFHADTRPPARVPLDRIRDVVVLGQPTIEGRALRELMRRGVTVYLADESGRVLSTLTPDQPLEDGAAVSAQAAAQGDESWRVELAKSLVAAKLRNHAALADAYPGRDRDHDTGRYLRQLARQTAAATSVDQILGLEGAGAARWYARLSGRLPGYFSFEHRVAPDAEDPVNVMLNIAHTALYRVLVLLIRQAGLVPSLGVLHRVHNGHAALASDLHEPLRHLMERAVLETAPRLRRSDFTPTGNPDYPLRVSGRAARALSARIHHILAISCHGRGQSEPRPYRWQAQAMVRSLKQHLVRRDDSTFDVFEHP